MARYIAPASCSPATSAARSLRPASRASASRSRGSSELPPLFRTSSRASASTGATASTGAPVRTSASTRAARASAAWKSRALHAEVAEVFELEVAADQRRRRRRQVADIGRGERLHALRQTDGVSLRGVAHAEIVADRADDDLARVEAHAGREADAVLALHLGGVAGELALQVERRVARALGVVLAKAVSSRRPRCTALHIEQETPVPSMGLEPGKLYGALLSTAKHGATATPHG